MHSCIDWSNISHIQLKWEPCPKVFLLQDHKNPLDWQPEFNLQKYTCLYLSMGFASFRVKPSSNNFSILHNHTSHHGIWGRLPKRLLRELHAHPYVHCIFLRCSLRQTTVHVWGRAISNWDCGCHRIMRNPCSCGLFGFCRVDAMITPTRGGRGLGYGEGPMGFAKTQISQELERKERPGRSGCPPVVRCGRVDNR